MAFFRYNKYSTELLKHAYGSRPVSLCGRTWLYLSPAEHLCTFQQLKVTIRIESFICSWNPRSRCGQGGEHWLLINLLLVQLIYVSSSYCWPARNSRLTETKQCSAYSQNVDSSQNMNNAFRKIMQGIFWVCVCELFEFISASDSDLIQFLRHRLLRALPFI